MSKIFTEKSLKWLVPVIALAVIAFFVYQYWEAQQSALPKGIASGNGAVWPCTFSPRIIFTTACCRSTRDGISIPACLPPGFLKMRTCSQQFQGDW